MFAENVKLHASTHCGRVTARIGIAAPACSPQRLRLRAFSFVEASVAITITTIMMSSFAGAVHLMVKAPTQLHERAQARRQGQLVIQKLVTELRNAKIIRGVTLDDAETHIALTIPLHLIGPDYEIIAYQWDRDAQPPALNYHYNIESSSGNWQSSSAPLLLNCESFNLRLEYESSSPIQVASADCPNITGDAGCDLELAQMISTGETVVHVRAIHIELKIAYGITHNETYTITETIHCLEKPKLLSIET